MVDAELEVADRFWLGDGMYSCGFSGVSLLKEERSTCNTFAFIPNRMVGFSIELPVIQKPFSN